MFFMREVDHAMFSLDLVFMRRNITGSMRSHIRPLSCLSNLVPSTLAALLLIGILTLLGCAAAHDPAYTDGNYRVVERVIDGDTLVMEKGERVRLIGVDTPETKHPRKPVEHFGKEAAAFTKRMVEGKRVRLEFDPANATRAPQGQHATEAHVGLSVPGRRHVA
jgi:endonuclease YncB( thermonuclease family)